jgi:hypothetical protein
MSWTLPGIRYLKGLATQSQAFWQVWVPVFGRMSASLPVPDYGRFARHSGRTSDCPCGFVDKQKATQRYCRNCQREMLSACVLGIYPNRITSRALVAVDVRRPLRFLVVRLLTSLLASHDSRHTAIGRFCWCARPRPPPAVLPSRNQRPQGPARLRAAN